MYNLNLKIADRKTIKKKNILIIGRGYISYYLENSGNQYFNIRSISSKQLSVKKKITNIDAVLHAIGLNVKQSLIDPKKALTVKREFTNKIIKFCRYNKIPKIIYISSIHVYKNNLFGNIDETTKCTNKHPYAFAHMIAEDILKKNSSINLKVIIIRVGNLFGINNNKKSSFVPLINKIMKEFALNQKVIIYNKFLQRVVVPMNYFILILSKLILLNKKIQIINVGYKSYFLIDLVNIIKKLAKKNFNFLANVKVIEDKFLKKSLNYKSLFLKKEKSHKLIIKEINNSFKFLKKN